MERLADLIKRTCQPGQVTWIGLRPARLAEMTVVDQTDVTTDGLKGDRGRAGKRAVTLVQAEDLDAIGSFLGRTPVPPEMVRRNLVIAGINLAALKGREVAIGTSVLRFVGPCAPCSRMEDAFGPGGYSAMRGHGGWCAEVVLPGLIRLGDSVQPID